MTSTLSPPNYDEDVDFAALALQDADFAKVLDSKGHIDFHDPKAVQQLTKSLLKRDFQLAIELPDDRLCPPVPVRYNYVRWIQDLLDTTSETYSDQHDPKRQVIGLDIGTGASAIYTLLLLQTRPTYRMCATDIDAISLASARVNIEANNLAPRCRLLHTQASDPLIPLDALKVERLDFTICNPPFYASEQEMRDAFHGTGKRAKPSAVCTGAEIEMIYAPPTAPPSSSPSTSQNVGGDAGFVLRMIEESRMLQEKVQWYSSMLGKLSSVNVVVKRLKEVGVGNWAVACLRAGQKTRRWAVAWSWGEMRPRNDVARRDMSIKDVLPFPTEYVIAIEGDGKAVAGTINEALNALDLRWMWRENLMAGVGLARENVWSRSARRKKKRLEVADEKTEEDMDTESDEDEEVALGFKISVQKDAVVVRWLRGRDSVLFESFCGMVKRTLSGKT